MLLDCLGYPINVGDTVVHCVTDLLGVVTDRVFEVEGTNTAPMQYVDVLFEGKSSFIRTSVAQLISIYPMTEVSNDIHIGSAVVFPYLEKDLTLTSLLSEVLSLSSAGVVMKAPIGLVSRGFDEVLVMDDRVQYLKDHYPELLL